MSEADHPPLVQALLDPASYPHPARHVELIQTHISYVFLTDEYVYKIKKPVDFGFLNYSTLGKRKFYCQREVKLNSLLCDETYLGVVPIRKDGSRYVVDGKRGEVVEYAVWMRRLPEERMLNRLIERGEATPAMMKRVAEKLVPFHEQTAQRSPAMARYGDWAIRYNHQENVDQWTPYVGRTLTSEEHAVSVAYGEAFFARKAEVLARRVKEQRIVQTHADLRSDAICMEDGVCIMDAVEFNKRISVLDVARDVGFLQMDLEYRDRPDLAEAFVRRYLQLAHDPDLREVLPFYAYYSACVRGKVENFLLDIPSVPEKDKRAAAKRAKRYFELACEYAKTLPPAMLVIMCGLSGTGKSTVAREVAKPLRAKVLVSDIVRKKLLGIEPTQRAVEVVGDEAYSVETTKRTFDAMFAEARESLLRGQSVVLDATFLRRDLRKVAMRLARDTGAQFACVEVWAPDGEVRKRLHRRTKAGRGVSDAGWEVYLQQKRKYQRPTEIPKERLVRVESMRRKMTDVVKRLRSISPLSVR